MVLHIESNQRARSGPTPSSNRAGRRAWRPLEITAKPVPGMPVGSSFNPLHSSSVMGRGRSLARLRRRSSPIQPTCLPCLLLPSFGRI